MGDQFCRIRVEVEGLKQTVVAHLDKVNDRINSEIQREIDNITNSDRLSLMVESMVDKEIHRKVYQSISEYFDSRGHKQRIADMVAKTITRELKRADRDSEPSSDLK